LWRERHERGAARQRGNLSITPALSEKVMRPPCEGVRIQLGVGEQQRRLFRAPTRPTTAVAGASRHPAPADYNAHKFLASR
jgi:hypothetical protein